MAYPINREEDDMRILTLIGATMIGVSFLAISPVQANDIECGDDFEPNETVVLHEDIVCDGPGFALRINSTSTLDLNGFTIFCEGFNPATGIIILGERSKVMNGEVLGADVITSLKPEPEKAKNPESQN